MLALCASSLRTIRECASLAQVFVGLDGSAEELGIGAQNMWAFSSPHLEEELAAYSALEEPTPAALDARDVPLIFISFPSAKVRARGPRRITRGPGNIVRSAQMTHAPEDP